VLPFLGSPPLEELLKAPEEVVGVARSPILEDLRDEVLDVSGLDVVPLGHVVRKPVRELAGCLCVDPDRLG
jgi:hypothetical protein